MLFLGCRVVFLMLRASSLGLSLLPSPNFYPRQRVCCLGTRWVTIRRTSRKTATQFNAMDVEGDLALRGKQVHTKSDLPTAHLTNSASLTVRENSSDPLTKSQPMSATKTASKLPLSQPEPPKPLERIYSTLETPKSSQLPSYAAGRPWSIENVQKVNLPKYILNPLRRLRVEWVRAHRQYIETQNAGKVTRSKKSPRRDKKAQTASKVTPSMKEPPLQDCQAQNAGEVIPSMKKPPQDPTPLLLQHFEVIGTTNSVDEGWNSYVFLVDLIYGSSVVQRYVQHIPFSHLHRLARLLSRNRPQTRRQFLRLLAVLTYLNYWGGELKQYEWNALVIHAGSGWRKTKLEDFGNAMKVFNDMRAGRLPGSSDLPPVDKEFLEGPAFQPDIYTYTSLLTIASRSRDSKNVYNISSMLSQAGLPPNRITHLSLMRYFTLKPDLGGIRATLLKMRQQGLELGLDGLNACLWAYGRNARVDIVMMIYRALRHNAMPESDVGRKDLYDTIGRLGEEYIFVEPELRPNEVTLTTVIQVMAYHGHFTSTLNVFMDMISFNNLEKGAPHKEISAGVYEPTPYKPSLAVFRAIFLGFSRHAENFQHDSDWTLENLSQLFDLFVELPPDSKLTHNTIYLTMLAFEKASGRDLKILRDVWMRMDRRFGTTFHRTHSVSRLARLRQLLFPEEVIR